MQRILHGGDLEVNPLAPIARFSSRASSSACAFLRRGDMNG